ncbi:MAG: hypothetical protein ACTHK3_07230 [Solirubrobacterales bacterium]
MKMLGLGAVAALVLIAIAGTTSASATVLCKTPPVETPLGWTCPLLWTWGKGLPWQALPAPPPQKPPIIASTTGEKFAECNSNTLEGKTENQGSETETVRVKLTTLSFGECTGTVDTVVAGELEIHDISSEKGKGTVTAKALEFTLLVAGSSCSYGAGEGVDLGTLVGGESATLTVNAVLSKKSGAFLCPSDVRWQGNFQIPQPQPVWPSHFAD